MLELMKESGNIVAVVEDRLQTVYQACVPVYTDGSKDPNTGEQVLISVSFNILLIGEHQIIYQYTQ